MNLCKIDYKNLQINIQATVIIDDVVLISKSKFYIFQKKNNSFFNQYFIISNRLK